MDDTDPQMPFIPIETGLADAEVYQSADLSSHALHPNLNPNQVAKLARQMVMDILDEGMILRAAGISQEQFERFVKPTELYRRVYSTFLLEWQSPLSTNKRIAIMAAALLEDGLIDIADRMTDKREPLNHAVEAAKTLAKFAGVGESAAQGSLAPSERFTINIITSREADKISVAQSPQSEPIPENRQRQIDLAPIRLEPKGQSEE